MLLTLLWLFHNKELKCYVVNTDKLSDTSSEVSLDFHTSRSCHRWHGVTADHVYFLMIFILLNNVLENNSQCLDAVYMYMHSYIFYHIFILLLSLLHQATKPNLKIK